MKIRMNLHHVLFFSSLSDQQAVINGAKLIHQWSSEEIESGEAALTTFPTTTKQCEQWPSEETTATVSTVSHSDCPLVVAVCATVVCVALVAVFLLLLFKWTSKRKRETDGFNTRGNSDNADTEFVTYENCPPVSTCEASTYQSLHPASRGQDQTYYTLTQGV